MEHRKVKAQYVNGTFTGTIEQGGVTLLTVKQAVEQGNKSLFNLLQSAINASEMEKRITRK